MDYSINKDSLAFNELVFEGCQEQPVDLDFSLPDYCPDIQRILKCQVCPKVNTRNISGDRLDVEGIASIKLMYIDAIKKQIRCCENTMPFSCSFSMKSSPLNALINIKTKVEYVNCRALSPRRLDIHGAFSVCAKVSSKENNEIVCGINANDIEQKKVHTMSSNVIGMGQQQFTLEEVIELNSGKPSIESIIRTDASVSLTDYKAITNKLIVKGESTLRMLYISDIDSGELETMEYSIPISQIVDVDGVDEDSSCDVQLELLNYDVQIRTDGSGENNMVALDMKIVATAIAYTEQPIEILTDAYSKNYEIDKNYSNTSIPRLVERIHENSISKNTIELGEMSISRVIDLWSDVSSVNTTHENENIIFSGKVNICILAMDNENSPFYIERIVDFTHEHKSAEIGKDLSTHSEVDVTSISYRLTGSDSLELRLELYIEASIYEVTLYKFISDISINEDKPKKHDQSAALTIYYADEGEDLWDIARKYNTSLEAVKVQNDIDNDILPERKMLLIPM